MVIGQTIGNFVAGQMSSSGPGTTNGQAEASGPGALERGLDDIWDGIKGAANWVGNELQAGADWVGNELQSGADWVGNELDASPHPTAGASLASIVAANSGLITPAAAEIITQQSGLPDGQPNSIATNGARTKVAMNVPSWAWKAAGVEELIGGGPADPIADIAAGLTIAAGVFVEGVILTNEEAKSPEIDPGEIAGKTPDEIDQIAREKGLIPMGPDPMNRKGAYIDPVTGEQRILIHPDPGGSDGHAHVNDPSGQRLDVNGRPVDPNSPDAHLPLGM